tara:strand:+ start:555 stop:791 length:237 start_codon:yes stop_codon:yes gene_type:complete
MKQKNKDKLVKIFDIAECFKLIFKNDEGGILFVTPPNVYGNYDNNNWLIENSAGWNLQFETGDDALRWLKNKNYTKVN